MHQTSMLVYKQLFLMLLYATGDSQDEEEEAKPLTVRRPIIVLWV